MLALIYEYAQLSQESVPEQQLVDSGPFRVDGVSPIPTFPRRIGEGTNGLWLQMSTALQPLRELSRVSLAVARRVTG